MVLGLLRLPRKRRKPRLPFGLRIYAVGDVHGRIDLLNEVLRRIDFDLDANPPLEAREVYLGDYVDRGPASREVVDRLIDRRGSHDTVFLKGNHEVLMLEFLRSPEGFNYWRRIGAHTTLMSYGIATELHPDPHQCRELAKALEQALPFSHQQFLLNLKLYFTSGDYLFVHAGVKPGVALELQHEADLTGIRDDFLFSEQDFGKIVVHGHTPVLEPEFHSNRINIDTGAYATGRLTCLKLEGEHVSVL